MNSSNSFLFTNFLFPTKSTNGQLGVRSIESILFIPIFLYIEASLIVKVSFWFIGTLLFSSIIFHFLSIYFLLYFRSDARSLRVHRNFISLRLRRGRAAFTEVSLYLLLRHGEIRLQTVYYYSRFCLPGRRIAAINRRMYRSGQYSVFKYQEMSSSIRTKAFYII